MSVKLYAMAFNLLKKYQTMISSFFLREAVDKTDTRYYYFHSFFVPGFLTVR